MSLFIKIFNIKNKKMLNTSAICLQHKVQQSHAVREILDREVTKFMEENCQEIADQINFKVKKKIEQMELDFDNCVKQEIENRLLNEIDERIQDATEKLILKQQYPFQIYLQNEINSRINNEAIKKMVEYENNYNNRVQEKINSVLNILNSDYQFYIEEQVKERVEKELTSENK